MKTILCLVALLSLTVYVKAEKQFSIRVNDTQIGDMISDFREFGEEYLEHTESERKELLRQLANSWKTVSAKLILNFGKDIVPVIDAWAEIMKDVQVNDDCDQDCAVKCLDPRAKDTLFFNP